MVLVAPQRSCIFPTLKHRNRHMVSTAYSAQRGGMDLAQRHTRLNLRNSHPQISALTAKRSMENNSRIPVGKTFRGLKIPQRPLPPTAEECCMSRCETCVHDLYITSLHRYRQDLREVRDALSEMRVSNQEWPVEIRINDNHDEDTIDKETLAATEAANRAFQEMKHAEKSQSWRTRDAWLEATKLAVWVLRGCRG